MKSRNWLLIKTILLISGIFIFLLGFIFLFYYNETFFINLWKHDFIIVYYFMLWITNPSLYLIISLLIAKMILNKDFFVQYEKLKEERNKAPDNQKELNKQYVKRINKNRLIIKILVCFLIIITNLFFTFYCRREPIYYRISPFLYFISDGSYYVNEFILEHLFFTLISFPIIIRLINKTITFKVEKVKFRKSIFVLFFVALCINCYVFLPIPEFRYYYEINKDATQNEQYVKFGNYINNQDYYAYSDEIVIYKRLNEKYTSKEPPKMPDKFWGIKVKDSYPYGFNWYHKTNEIMNYVLSPYLELDKLKKSRFCLLGRQFEVSTDTKKAKYTIIKTEGPLNFTLDFNGEKYSLSKYDHDYSDIDISGYDEEEKITINKRKFNLDF